MAVGAAIAGGIATGAAGALLSDGGGGGGALKRFKPVGVSAGGLSAKLTRERELVGHNLLTGKPIFRKGKKFIDVSASPERREAVRALRERLLGESEAIAGLRERAVGEFGQLRQELENIEAGLQDTLSESSQNQLAALEEAEAGQLEALTAAEEAQLNELAATERRSIGNLRDNLQRRRILGSSFAADAVSRRAAEFGLKRGQARSQFGLQRARLEGETGLRRAELIGETGLRRAELESRFGMQRARSRLEQLDIESDLISREFQAEQQAAQTALDELNQRLNLSASLATGSTQALASNAQLRAQLAQDRAAGRGALVGTLAGTLGPPLLENHLNNNNSQPSVNVNVTGGGTFTGSPGSTGTPWWATNPNMAGG